jgi:hypothetical protein
MVTGYLTPEMEEAGEALTRELDRQGFTVRAALWLNESETGLWKLLLGIAEVDSLGPLDVYKSLRTLLQNSVPPIRSIGLGDVSVESPNEPFLKALRRFVKTGRRIKHMRLSKNAISGRYIDDALIYRLI